jgi:ABC-type multidrug transport system permease subunit
MLGTLLIKDFRRTLRNPWPWLMNLSLPIAITALIGFAFGGRGGTSDGEVRIKFAVVDEDKSFLSGALRSMFSQGEAGARLDPVFVERVEALRVLRENQISAILIIPTNFTKQYLQGESGLKLEVIKNPAQTYLPAIIEEMAEVAVTGLNAISRNLNSEFPALRAATTNADWNVEVVMETVRKIGSRIKTARAYLDPPLVSYGKEVKEKKAAEGNAPASSPKPVKEKSMITSVFGYILPGMASAFLLFIADQSMRDFHREIRMKTLDRQRTVGVGSGMLIASKIIFTALTVALAGAILFAGGSLIFGIDWGRPGLLALALIGYSLFAAGFLSALIATAPGERRTEVMNSMVLFAVAFTGGSYLPSDNFPPFMRENIVPLMPNHWLIQTARTLQNESADYHGPLMVVLQLAVAGIVLGVIAAFVINRRVTAGARA